jgi:hypothetical protein
MGPEDEQRFNDLQAEFWTEQRTRQHLEARVSMLEAVCLTLAGQTDVKESVLSRLRETNDSVSAVEVPHSQGAIDVHYFRRFVARLEDL